MIELKLQHIFQAWCLSSTERCSVKAVQRTGLHLPRGGKILVVKKAFALGKLTHYIRIFCRVNHSSAKTPHTTNQVNP